MASSESESGVSSSSELEDEVEDESINDDEEEPGETEEKSQKDRILTASKTIWMFTSWHKTLVPTLCLLLNMIVLEEHNPPEGPPSKYPT